MILPSNTAIDAAPIKSSEGPLLLSVEIGETIPEHESLRAYYPQPNAEAECWH